MRVKFTRNKAFTNVISLLTNRLQEETLDRVRAVMYRALEYAAKTSPQYTGTYASNWRLSRNKPAPGNIDLHDKDKASELDAAVGEGNYAAVARALSARGNKLSTLTKEDKIYLSTRGYNRISKEDYTWDIESNSMRFRDVNPSRGRVVGRTVDKIKEYIREARAQKLKGIR